MTTSDPYIVNAGTATTGDVLTYSNPRGTWSAEPVFLPSTNDPDTGIGRTARTLVTVKKPPQKGFWDGVEWDEYTAYVPRKSITDTWIIGKMYKRWRTPPIEARGIGLGTFKQYATRKELFTEKLKGKA